MRQHSKRSSASNVAPTLPETLASVTAPSVALGSVFDWAEHDSLPVDPSGRKIEEWEMNGLFMELRGRMEMGRDKYQGSFTRADLRADMVEECLDLANYALLLAARIRRVFPEVTGTTSNHIYENMT
jgi:hypothetical protein